MDDAKECLKKSIDELCYANNHLNEAFETAKGKHEKIEICEARKTLEEAIVSAEITLTDFK